MQIGVATSKKREFGSFSALKIHSKIKYYKFQQSLLLFGAEKHKLPGDTGIKLLELLDFIHTIIILVIALPPEPRPPGYYYSFILKLKI